MSTRNAFTLCIVIELGIIALGFINYGFNVDGLQAVTRFSGRFSLLIFSVIFLASHISNIQAWLSKKPFHVFALAHGIHLIELLLYLYISESALIISRIAGGFVAYMLIFIMPVIADRNEKGQFGDKKFRLFQIIFQYYVWLVFFLTYLPRVNGSIPHVGGTYLEHVVLLGWVSLMLGMKLPRVLFKRKRVSE